MVTRLSASFILGQTLLVTAARFGVVPGYAQSIDNSVDAMAYRMHTAEKQIETVDKSKMAEEIKKAFLFSWNSYTKYAWGYDELDPIAKKGSNLYPVSFYMMPVDAMDTMILMGLKKEAVEDGQLVESHLGFDKDLYVSTFELTICFVGGLLASYELTGDRKLLNLAEGLAHRELAAFKSPTWMPYSAVNLKTGGVKGAVSNPAGAGTLLLEFGTLTKLTGNFLTLSFVLVSWVI